MSVWQEQQKAAADLALPLRYLQGDWLGHDCAEGRKVTALAQARHIDTVLVMELPQ